MYLPGRVLRQYGHMQSIPRHPRESAPTFLTAPATALIAISLHFAGFMERVLTAAQRGPLGDPPRPCERDAIMEEQADMVGPLMSRLQGKLTAILGIADKILAYGELAKDSHSSAEEKKKISIK
ncbi:hypothetical protein P8452_28617 [Trifolium repens]|nr:hypothetical protein P8452_28617 [Trifolium repens]